MTELIVDEWRQRELGVLIVGGHVMVADGLREETKDLDACLSSRQCPRMLEWLREKDRPGARVKIRPGSAPLHPDWLGRGWTFHVELGGTVRLDFFGIPLRAPNRLRRRFDGDAKEVTLASLTELGNLKRSERAKDWADIELIVGRLRERGDADAVTLHLFGNALVEELMAQRDRESFRIALARSQQANERPILRLGLTAPLGELRAMARAEQRFWEVAGALRSDEIKDTATRFWRQHRAAIAGRPDFATQHATLLDAARSDLPVSPIGQPRALIEAALAESGAVRWPELLPPINELVAQYFPEYRSASDGARRPDETEGPSAQQP